MEFIQRNKKLLIVLCSLLATLLLVVILALVVLLLRPNAELESTNNNDQDGVSSFGGGTVSNLKGGVASYRNLKGLTLRVNQIETCNPTQLTAYVSVSSEAGLVNTNFGKNDVSVYLDGKKISNFEFNRVDTKTTPLSNMLLIDRSGSMTTESMENAKNAARNYVGKLQSGDQTGVIQFDHLVEPLVSLTTDKASVSRAISDIVPRGDTAIFDAIGAGIDAVPDCGRKAVTVLTDGEDTASESFTLSTVTDKTTQKNMPVFAVGIKSPSFDPTAIREIAEKSGGLYLEADTPSNISSLYENIDGQLRGQFVTNFKMPIKKTNTMHTLKIITTVEGSDTGSERVFLY